MWFVDCRSGRARLVALLSSPLLIWNGVNAADLTLREVVALTSERNPQLASFAHESEAVRQRSFARAATPPISIEGELENFAGTGEVSGVRALETTLQLSKVFELGGKAELRSALGTAEIDNVEVRQRAARADVIAEAARRFLHVLSDQAQLDVTRRAAQLAEQGRDVVRARIREGAISTVFLNRAEIEVARARIAHEHAEHELAASRVALSVMWGDTTPSFDRATGDLFAFANTESVESYLARLEQNPDVLRFASEERMLEARRRLAESQRAPNVTLSAGVRRLEALDDEALVASFSWPIGARSRAEPELRAAQAEGEQLRLNVRGHRLELHSVLFGLYQELLHARTEADVLRDDIRPQAQTVVETTTAGYRLGRYSLVELIDAQQALIEVERDSIRAALEFHNNLIEIERATGVGVHTPVDR